ncbi:hypothetical protein TNCV_4134861 [Trichonephila clavipes]|nr:hypothetical protein TNCV_4134861 [Trichonephila clavipes]
MVWEDIPFLPEVIAPFVTSRSPRKMRLLFSVQVSEPPSLSANRFPNMRALIPKSRLYTYAQLLTGVLSPPDKFLKVITFQSFEKEGLHQA